MILAKVHKMYLLGEFHETHKFKGRLDNKALKIPETRKGSDALLA